MEIEESPDNVKFLVTYDHEDRDDELIAYNEILDYVEQEIEADKDPLRIPTRWYGSSKR